MDLVMYDDSYYEPDWEEVEPGQEQEGLQVPCAVGEPAAGHSTEPDDAYLEAPRGSPAHRLAFRGEAPSPEARSC
jgi:hypothetical protein